MNHIHLTNDNVVGVYEWKGKLDLINIVMIGLGKELAVHDEKIELHRLLGTLLSKNLSADEKFDIMENEYNIPIEDNLRKDVSVMCNLSQGIKEDGITIGQEIGQTKAEERIILNMNNNGFTAEQISIATGRNTEDIKAIIDGKTCYI